MQNDAFSAFGINEVRENLEIIHKVFAAFFYCLLDNYNIRQSCSKTLFIHQMSCIFCTHPFQNKMSQMNMTMKNYCYAILVFFAQQGVSFLCQSNILGLRVRCSLFSNLSCQSSLKMDSNLSFYLNAIYYFEITKPSINLILKRLQALANFVLVLY